VQAEPLKANGEASGADKRGHLRSRLLVLIDVKFYVIGRYIWKKSHAFEYYPNRVKTRLGVIRYLLIVIGFLIFKIGIISPLIEI
jgi:hypothetical protein